MEVLNGCVPIIDTGELNFILTLSGKGTWKATGAAQKRANLHYWNETGFLVICCPFCRQISNRLLVLESQILAFLRCKVLEFIWELVALGSGSTCLCPKIWARFCRKMHFQELEPMVYILGISLV